MLGILVGFMTAAWLFTVAGVAYATWRYNYVPWKVMRADVTAMNQKVEELKGWVQSEIGARRALALSDEDLARAEARLRARRASGVTV